MTSVSYSCVRDVLILGGMPPSIARNTEMQVSHVPSNSGNVYALTSPQGEMSYLKLFCRPGARGGFFTKFFCGSTKKERAYGAARRALVRKLIPALNSMAERVTRAAGTPFPRPMGIGDWACSTGRAKEEVCLDPALFSSERFSRIPAELHHCFVNRWAKVEGSPFPVTGGENIFDPIHYRIEDLRRIGVFFYTLKESSERILEGEVDQDALPQLVHERRSLVNIEWLKETLIVTFQPPNSSSKNALEALKEFAEGFEKRVSQERKKIAGELDLAPALSLAKIQQELLARFPDVEESPLAHRVVSHADAPDFHRKVFFAEKHQQWSAEQVAWGRRVCQLCNAEEVVEDILRKESALMGKLLFHSTALATSYEKIFSLGKSLVPQDGHPANFLVEESGALHLIDLDDFSYDFWCADLVHIYLFKIVRAFMAEKISGERAWEMVEALFAPFSLKKQELQNLYHLRVASQLNHMRDWLQGLSLDRADAKDLSLPLTLHTLVEGIEAALEQNRCYKSLVDTFWSR